MSKILVVDDQQENLKAIRRIFVDESDLQLDFAESGIEALRKVKDFTPDLVLLDIMMPVMDGYEVCQAIKRSETSSDTLVMLLSGRNSLDDRLKGYEVSADDYITKPYDADELKAKVRILLRLKNAQDELKYINANLESLVEQGTRELVKQERQAVIGQMVQGIVHNLRGPLTAMYGYTDLARNRYCKQFLQNHDYPEEELHQIKKIDDYLAQSILAQKKLEDLITSLLDHSRKDAAQETELLDLNKVIINELEFLEADRAIKHRINKVLYLSKEIPKIQGLHSDFSQVICNLVQNAAHAMHDSLESVLTISTSVEGQDIVVKFQDTGKGIIAGHQERIFEPFFTSKATLESAKDGEPVGTGIGLHTCNLIISNYDGEITAENNGEQGACFTIKLPYGEGRG